MTIYRDPQRDPANAPDLDMLGGYALISETRTISLPAGESRIRFEGVAGGIIAQSAIITGFPEGVIERNRDAYLLSPATLLDRSLGRRVHLRRTSLATGAVREHEAIIRSSADGAVILQTTEGYEALRCTGLNETPIYDSVPADLSARPTLSVRARTTAPVTATITLSYLANGFDWQANYIANLSPDGSRLELFAWLTLASNDETSFANADTQAVAGQLNREPVPPQPREGGPLRLRCWPQSRTSDIPYQGLEPAPPPPPPAPMMAGESIVVTGSLARSADLMSSTPVTVLMAEQEALGDLKLYRIPEPVTVAANSQKQVALLQRSNVEVAIVYRQRVSSLDGEDPQPVVPYLVTRNRDAEGLGLPLPAGRMAIFVAGADRPMLFGEGYLADRAIGNDVEIPFGAAAGVDGRIALVRERAKGGEYELVVTNDQSRPIRYEAEFVDAAETLRPGRRLGRRDGHPLWAVTVPANGSATLRYRYRAARNGN